MADEEIVELNVHLLNPGWKRTDPDRWERAIALVTGEPDVTRVVRGKEHDQVFFKAPISKRTIAFLVDRNKRLGALVESST